MTGLCAHVLTHSLNSWLVVDTAEVESTCILAAQVGRAKHAFSCGSLWSGLDLYTKLRLCLVLLKTVI